jgi:ABC-type transport system substrate-binding protein
VATVDKPVNMDPATPSCTRHSRSTRTSTTSSSTSTRPAVHPRLAKSWKQESEKSWLFDLVDNAVFHNGEAMTAKDVAFTFARILDTKNKLPMRVFFSPVEAVEAVGQSRRAST